MAKRIEQGVYTHLEVHSPQTFQTYFVVTFAKQHLQKGGLKRCDLQIPASPTTPTRMELTIKSIGAAVIYLVLMALLSLKVRTLSSRDKEPPPGPKNTPCLGNALEFPTVYPHLKWVAATLVADSASRSVCRFFEWSRRYGDVYSLKILNQTIIIVSSPKAVKDTLDIQGLHTGNRVCSALVQRIHNGAYIVVENMENPVWKLGRKAIHTFLTEGSLER